MIVYRILIIKAKAYLVFNVLISNLKKSIKFPKIAKKDVDRRQVNI